MDASRAVVWTKEGEEILRWRGVPDPSSFKMLVVPAKFFGAQPVHAEPLPTARAEARGAGALRKQCAGRLHAPWLREARHIIDKLRHETHS